MRTAETVTVLGLYMSECCSSELIFDTGDALCRCPNCQSLCNWELEVKVISHEDLDSYEELEDQPFREFRKYG